MPRKRTAIDPADKIKERYAELARKRVGDRIKALRQDRRWTREDLAQSVGISARAIEKYEQGKREPQLWMLEIFAGQFKVTIDALFRDTSEPKKPMPLAKINFDN